MRKIVSIALLINFFITPFQPIAAEGFADANDTFTVISPVPNSKVSGNTVIEWNSFDDDQTSIPYYVELFDGATCKNTSFGRINPNAGAISSKTTNNKFVWDSKKTESKSIADGSYCMVICSAFKNNDKFYSLCNGRNIRVVNTNRLPTITSSPTNLIINESETWEYKINATDPDNDRLTYYLVYAPDFLEITSNGQLKTKGGIARINNEIATAEYRIVIGVDDGISGTTTQEFTLRVERGRVPNTPTQPEPTEPTPEVPQNVTSQITITNPKENTEFKGSQNFIEWTIYEPDGVKEITLSYSSNLEDWNEIITNSQESFSRYSWDVSNIEDGKYYIQIKVKDNKDEVVAKISKPFFIKNLEEAPIEAKPLIINVKPENNKELIASPSTITGDFAPAENQEIDIDSFTIRLNDTLLQECVVNPGGFQCNIDNNLIDGEYKLVAEIKDLNGNTGNYESKFMVKKAVVAPSETTNNNSGNLIIIIAAIILLILILVVPWILISMSKRRKVNTSSQTNNEFKAYNANLQPLPQQPISYSPTPVVAAPPQQQNQSQNFSDFMSTYNFNDTQPNNINIGQVKQKQPGNKNNTFKNLVDKVTNFKPNLPINQANPSQPVQLSNNPNLSKNIQTAYEGNTQKIENFVEPSIIEEPEIKSTTQPIAPVTQMQTPSTPVTPDKINEYVTPQSADGGEEELKKMYPELYGATTNSLEDSSKNPTKNSNNSDYFEPTPKD